MEAALSLRSSVRLRDLVVLDLIMPVSTGLSSRKTPYKGLGACRVLI